MASRSSFLQRNWVVTNVEIVTKGEGQLYYFWESEGISVSGAYKEEDNYIKVRRQFYDRNGRAISRQYFFTE